MFDFVLRKISMMVCEPMKPNPPGTNKLLIMLHDDIFISIVNLIKKCFNCSKRSGSNEIMELHREKKGEKLKRNYY